MFQQCQGQVAHVDAVPVWQQQTAGARSSGAAAALVGPALTAASQPTDVAFASDAKARLTPCEQQIAPVD